MGLTVACVYWSVGEANRLVASLIKNSTHCKGVMSTVARCGALPHLVRMSTAEHIVMQNEALIALTILTTVLTGESYVVIASRVKAVITLTIQFTILTVIAFQVKAIITLSLHQHHTP